MAQQICLMLTNKENKKFFLYKKNMKHVLDFAKNFDCTVSIVKTEIKNIQKMSDFAKSFCNQNYNDLSPDYVVIKKDIICKKKDRKKTASIRNIIEESFLKNQRASLREIKAMFLNEKISTSSLSIHFSKVRKNLRVRGVEIEMVKKGTYVIKTSPQSS